MMCKWERLWAETTSRAEWCRERARSIPDQREAETLAALELDITAKYIRALLDADKAEAA